MENGVGANPAGPQAPPRPAPLAGQTSAGTCRVPLSEGIRAREALRQPGECAAASRGRWPGPGPRARGAAGKPCGMEMPGTEEGAMPGGREGRAREDQTRRGGGWPRSQGRGLGPLGIDGSGKSPGFRCSLRGRRRGGERRPRAQRFQTWVLGRGDARGGGGQFVLGGNIKSGGSRGAAARREAGCSRSSCTECRDGLARSPRGSLAFPFVVCLQRWLVSAWR